MNVSVHWQRGPARSDTEGGVNTAALRVDRAMELENGSNRAPLVPARSMNIKHLKFFLQVAEIGSLTQAAAVLCIAQPALSRQIQQLEDELGVTLFRRSERGVALTDAGRLLRSRAAPLLMNFDNLRQEMRDAFNEPSGTVVLAMPPSLFDLLTMPTVREYRRTYTSVFLRLYEGISAVMNASTMVSSGAADLAVVTNLEPLATLENRPFVTEPLCLIGPVEAKLQERGRIDLESVSALPLVLTSRPNTLRLLLETAVATANLPLNVAMEANSSPALLGAVEAGVGYTVLPFSGGYKMQLHGRVSIVPIADIEVHWNTVQLRSHALSTGAARLLDLLRATARAQIDCGLWLHARMPVEGTAQRRPGNPGRHLSSVA